MFGGKAPPSPKAVEADAVRSVFLFTDGQANDGVTEPERLVTMVRSLLDSVPRVRVYTFGFGHDHDEHLLSKLQRRGAGATTSSSRRSRFRWRLRTRLGACCQLLRKTSP